MAKQHAKSSNHKRGTNFSGSWSRKLLKQNTNVRLITTLRRNLSIIVQKFSFSQSLKQFFLRSSEKFWRQNTISNSFYSSNFFRSRICQLHGLMFRWSILQHDYCVDHLLLICLIYLSIALGYLR